MYDIIHEFLWEWREEKAFQLYKITDYCSVDTLQKDGMLYSDSQDKANVLNQYFPTLFTNSNNSSDLPNMGPNPYPDITEIIYCGIRCM